MSLSDAQTVTKQVRRMALSMAVVAIGLFALGVVVQAVLRIAIYVALGWSLIAVASAVFIGAIASLLLSRSYLEDRGSIGKGLSTVRPYATRALTWGLAGGGIGALLATALPQSVVQVFADPNALPLPGWLAIVFGGVGVALGLLEAAHQELSD